MKSKKNIYFSRLLHKKQRNCWSWCY